MTTTLATQLYGPADAKAWVVLLHGVGFGPESFAAVADRLASSSAGGHGLAVVVVTRPGYGEAPEPDSHPVPGRDPATAPRSVPPSVPNFDQQVQMIAATIDTNVPPDRPVTIAGVSGGATFGLALAMAAPSRWRAAVVHEPLVGPSAPDLHARVGVAAQALAAGDAGGDEAAAPAFVERLVGSSAWAAAPDEARVAVGRRSAVIADEVPGFASFAPAPDALEGLRRCRLVTTLGAASGPERRQAAGVLADLAGALVIEVPDAGHLVQLDQPLPWADLIAAEAVGP